MRKGVSDVSLSLALYLVGVILLGLAAFGANPPRVHLGWLGLAIIGVGALILPAV